MSKDSTVIVDSEPLNPEAEPMLSHSSTDEKTSTPESRTTKHPHYINRTYAAISKQLPARGPVAIVASAFLTFVIAFIFLMTGFAFVFFATNFILMKTLSGTQFGMSVAQPREYVSISVPNLEWKHHGKHHDKHREHKQVMAASDKLDITGLMASFGPHFEDFAPLEDVASQYIEELKAHEHKSHGEKSHKGHKFHKGGRHHRRRSGCRKSRTRRLLNLLARKKNTQVTKSGFSAPVSVVMDLACPVNGVEDFSVFRETPLLSSDEIANSIYADVEGKIAVIPRGACSFYYKVLLMQQHGAVGVLVGDFEDGNTEPLFMINKDITKENDIDQIPSALITKNDYEVLKEQVVVKSLGEDGNGQFVVTVAPHYTSVGNVFSFSILLACWSFFLALVIVSRVVRARMSKDAEEFDEEDDIPVAQLAAVQAKLNEKC